jgi:hypothetical protein
LVQDKYKKENLNLTSFNSLLKKWLAPVPHNNLLLDSAIIIGPLISRWELVTNTKIAEINALEPLKS